MIEVFKILHTMILKLPQNYYLIMCRLQEVTV